MNIQLAIDYLRSVPEITLLLGACVVLLLGALDAKKPNGLYVITQLILIIVLYLSFTSYSGEDINYFNDFYTIDLLAAYGKSAMCLLMIIVLIYSRAFIQQHQLPAGEYYALTLFSLMGMFLITSATNLLIVYLGLELLSLSLYAMVAMNRDESSSSEAAIKYFVLGAIASGFLLYGISLLYGLTATLDLHTLAERLPSVVGLGLYTAIVFIVIGIAFKFGAVPFHMWLPDIYQGAALPVTLLVASVPKIAGFMLAIRLLVDGMQVMHSHWQQIVLILSVLSLVVGNLIAIAQINLRRMLAYSTIGHVGYILLGLLPGNAEGYSASLFYTLIYALMSSAVFE